MLGVAPNTGVAALPMGIHRARTEGTPRFLGCRCAARVDDRSGFERPPRDRRRGSDNGPRGPRARRARTRRADDRAGQVLNALPRILPVLPAASPRLASAPGAGRVRARGSPTGVPTQVPAQKKNTMIEITKELNDHE